jgi:hypothetical protein
MPQPQLVQVALDAQGHNTISVDRDGGVWRGRIQRDRGGEEFNSRSQSRCVAANELIPAMSPDLAYFRLTGS